MINYIIFFKLENKIKNTVYNKSSEWFNTIPSENIKEIYKSLFDLPLKIDESPKINVKIPVVSGSIKSKFFDENGKLIGIKDLNNNQKVKLILKLNSIKLFESNYILDLYLYQLQISNNNNLVNYNHIFDESDDDIILSDSLEILSIK